jgi:ElaB/YqjD/DUF883 family membrane-anchored ribosome-binding protein
MGAEKKAEKMGAATTDAISGATTYATEQIGDLANRGQRLAQDADRQITEYTGRSSEEWIDQVSRLISTHPWKAVALAAAAVYLFGKLRD